MPTAREIADDPNYDAAATSASKATIFTFVATYGYMLGFSGDRPALIAGIVFFLVGMFAASLLISMPLFLLRTKYPRPSSFVALAEIGITILVTRTAYIWLLA